MAKYPIYLELSGRRVVVIGAGPVAARKVQSLNEAGARVVVIAERVDKAFEQACDATNIELIISSYSRDYLSEALLAIAATNDPDINRRIYHDCQQSGVLCNIADQPGLCDFFIPAVVKRGNLQIAVSTDGNCPAYAGHARKKLEDIFTDIHGRFVDELETIRKQVIVEVPDPAQRKAKLGQLVKDESLEYFMKNGPEAWRSRAKNLITQET